LKRRDSTIRKTELDQQKQIDALLKKAEKEAATKVDKAEHDRL